MKAVVCTKYGPPEVLQLREVETPTPRENEVRVRVRATTVMMGDCEVRGLRLSLPWKIMVRLGFGIRAPRKILGQELSGEVESLGKNVTRFKKGDQVFAMTGLHQGAYAEYDCLPENGLIATKPENATFEEAAAIPNGGLYALYFLKRANIESGQKVLINGAGGTIGTMAVQLARLEGAEVTAVDRIEKLDMLRSIGADKVIDYTKVDFTKTGEKYDVIFETVGKSSYSGCLKSLNEGGFLLLGNPSIIQMIRGGWNSKVGRKKAILSNGKHSIEDLAHLRELVEEGKIRPVIDRGFRLEQMVEAHRYVETGQKLGNVVITVPE